MMWSSHVYLIITGKSTVDSYRGRDQQEHENAALQAVYGVLWHNQEKRKVKRKWKEEWGGASVDERWRWGTNREMWEQEMGSSWIGWIRELIPGSQALVLLNYMQFPWVVRKVMACIIGRIHDLDLMASGSKSGIGQRSCNEVCSGKWYTCIKVVSMYF